MYHITKQRILAEQSISKERYETGNQKQPSQEEKTKRGFGESRVVIYTERYGKTKIIRTDAIYGIAVFPVSDSNRQYVRIHDNMDYETQFEEYVKQRDNKVDETE
ncbi:Hypothetical_protein [Hexamita inflata]|uniref:Hypothetical_protein n=1 Tax=Hexamita inflata TaxID=28002 RepID=A0AA86NU62_9EUKA|nr:Hypothetical protein HINF_LOCUS13296 [Hexamita inflata]